ncbi:putative ABC transporter permease [Hathewaya massiliensis]|uniref:putative ABC transporter permease n=1 Tax=Hathewaya massiliensis TaxID=1964382 RepID=UPI00115AEEBB|nr:putative ABC transporter permease [Hathewaya massiliensis]
MKISDFINSTYITLKNSFSLNELFFYFMFYSLSGWGVENLYSLFTKGKFKEEGFLVGPFKPMYGFAPVILLILLNGRSNKFLVLALCFIVPSVVEYISGAMLQKLFHKQWWDYSALSMQLNSHVCLKFSIYWIFLALATIYLLHPMVAKLYTKVEHIWIYLSPIIMLIFLVDVAFTTFQWRGKGELYNHS